MKVRDGSGVAEERKNSNLMEIKSLVSKCPDQRSSRSTK